jgi:membrane protease YdiL (CAAX protease family)
VRSAWVFYLVAAIAAELLLPFSPVATAILDAGVLVLALSHFGFAERSPLAIGDPAVRILPGIALVPLMRVLSLTLPLPTVAPIYWLAFSAPPALLGVLASARLASLDVQEMSLTRFGVDRVSGLLVVASALVGLGLGLLVPSPFAWDVHSPLATALTAAALIGAAAIPEELVYRGVLQPLLSDLLGRAGIVVGAGVFAATYAGSGSLPFMGGMAAVGLAYGWNTQRCASVWPALAGHTVLLMAQIIVAPLLS